MRMRWFWVALALLVGAGAALVWPSVVELWTTGHTNVHWSRFVVATNCFGSAAVLAIARGIDGVLDLLEQRVEYLRKRI
jgi:hypothetical protein